jgi:hypothetical protein
MVENKAEVHTDISPYEFLVERELQFPFCANRFEVSKLCNKKQSQRLHELDENIDGCDRQRPRKLTVKWQAVPVTNLIVIFGQVELDRPSHIESLSAVFAPMDMVGDHVRNGPELAEHVDDD